MKTKLFLIVSFVFIMTSCSTIFTSSSQRINMTSEPSEAKVIITNDNTSMKVFAGETPTTVTLKKGDGYFQGASYTVKVSKDGYKDVQIQITPHMTGWYIAGNFLVGGLIGWLIVDPMTGGMWTLSPTSVAAELKSNTVGFQFANKDALTIVMRSSIDDEVFKSLPLVQLN